MVAFAFRHIMCFSQKDTRSMREAPVHVGAITQSLSIEHSALLVSSFQSGLPLLLLLLLASFEVAFAGRVCRLEAWIVCRTSGARAWDDGCRLIDLDRLSNVLQTCCPTRHSPSC